MVANIPRRGLQLRDAHPAWGGRKIRHPLHQYQVPHCPVPGPSPPSCATGPSPIWRPFPTELPPIEYVPGAVVRRVQAKGEIALHGQYDPVGRAFPGYRVTVQFCHETIAELDLTQPEA